MTSSGEQSLDGEPSWNAGSLQAPTVDDDPTSQSNAVVSSKLTFRFAEPDPHEYVKHTVERLSCARVCCENRRERANGARSRGKT
jgi:hypothetical protein